MYGKRPVEVQGPTEFPEGCEYVLINRTNRCRIGYSRSGEDSGTLLQLEIDLNLTSPDPLDNGEGILNSFRMLEALVSLGFSVYSGRQADVLVYKEIVGEDLQDLLVSVEELMDRIFPGTERCGQ